MFFLFLHWNENNTFQQHFDIIIFSAKGQMFSSAFSPWLLEEIPFGRSVAFLMQVKLKLMYPFKTFPPPYFSLE